MTKIYLREDKPEKIIEECSICGEAVDVWGKIRINATNPWHRYKGSGLPFRSVRSLRLCRKCFSSAEEKISKIVYEERDKSAE